jgi:hypothetical protein
VKESVHSAQGSEDFEIDAVSIGRLLKWIMNSGTGDSSMAVAADGAGYKHTFKFGGYPKTVQVYEDVGGMNTPYYLKYLGMFMTNLSINLDMSGTLRGGMDFIGQTSAAGSDPGAPSVAASNLTFAYGDISYSTDTAGSTDISAMDAWTAPFDFEMNLMRINASNQNFNSDGTGKPTGIYEGEPAINLKLATELNTDHKMAEFEAGTEIALGISMDTGVASSVSNNYKLNFTFPRVRLEEYQKRAASRGKMVAVIPIKVMEDPTAGYSIKAELYNKTASYSDSTV